MLIVETQTVMRGQLLAAGAVRLDTWFEGDIVCSRLEIGSDGYVLGNVAAREVVVEGQIVGQIKAGAVRLLEGAFVEGDIHYASLSIHAAATLIGKSARNAGLELPSELMALEAAALRENAERDDQQTPARWCVVDGNSSGPPRPLTVRRGRQLHNPA